MKTKWYVLVLLLWQSSILTANIRAFRFSREGVSPPHLTRIISIDHVDTDSITAYANDREWKAFLEMNIPYRILTPVKDSKGLDMTNEDLRDIRWSKYPTYPAYLALMASFEKEYPEICHIDTLGYSVRGKFILAAEISGNLKGKEEKPGFFYTAQMHGDETATSVLMLRLIDTLLTAYADSSDIWRLVEDTRIWINPLANPDGAYYVSDSTLDGCIRYNANEEDLNRNFPDARHVPNPNTLPRQPETLAMMAFAEKKQIHLSANFHAGNECVNYPWDSTPDRHPETNWFISISREYADTVRYYAPDDYFNEFNEGVTNGYDWYAIYGGRQDFMNDYHSCKEVTIEISDIKIYPAGQLGKLWDYHKRSLLHFIKRVHEGLKGDFRNREQLPETVEILNLPGVSIPLETSDSLFFYPLEAGKYNICLHYPGRTDTLYQVEVKPHQLTDITRMPVHTDPPPYTPGTFVLNPPYPNPFNPETTIQLYTSTSQKTSLIIYNIQGHQIKTLYTEFLPAGTHTFRWDGTQDNGKEVASGIYIIYAKNNRQTVRQKAVIIR